jgi:glyoxylase-like metal-dependent hydrolase (beta-lactamase superfamily II)
MSFKAQYEKIEKTDSYYEIPPDVLCVPLMLVNMFLIGLPDKNSDWLVVDAGTSTSANAVIKAARERFGLDAKPGAILLTHGHFDHIGGIFDLLKVWDVPVYAHMDELPYLTDESDYPQPDPTVGGGLIAEMSPLFPRKGIDLGNRIHALPEGGEVPFAPNWKWIHTPGHTPGHISLFREDNRVMIAADAFTTVKQESAMAVLTKDKEVHGPPAYFTTDWKAAEESIKKLAAFNPSVVASSHGIPMRGEELTHQLETLAYDFDRVALPKQGIYIEH